MSRRKEKPVPVPANRMVTVTILARHAFNLAAGAERTRRMLYERCGADGSDVLKRSLTRSASEWRITSERLASAYEESLHEEHGYEGEVSR